MINISLKIVDLCQSYYLVTVLADRGFDVTDSVHSYQVELKMPTFTPGKKPVRSSGFGNTRGLASVRIHIERVIGAKTRVYNATKYNASQPARY